MWNPVLCNIFYQLWRVGLILYELTQLIFPEGENRAIQWYLCAFKERFRVLSISHLGLCMLGRCSGIRSVFLIDKQQGVRSSCGERRNLDVYEACSEHIESCDSEQSILESSSSVFCNGVHCEWRPAQNTLKHDTWKCALWFFVWISRSVE